jgi:ornithine--oxo-acid transaminase
VAFTEYNRNVIRLEPPLIARAEHVDAFLQAFEEILAMGVGRIVARYARKAIA